MRPQHEPSRLLAIPLDHDFSTGSAAVELRQCDAQKKGPDGPQAIGSSAAPACVFFPPPFCLSPSLLIMTAAFLHGLLPPLQPTAHTGPDPLENS